jgi:hypothetical protein
MQRLRDHFLKMSEKKTKSELCRFKCTYIVKKQFNKLYFWPLYQFCQKIADKQISQNPAEAWDRCYDYLNIFAKKFSKKLRFWLQTKINYAKFWS